MSDTQTDAPNGGMLRLTWQLRQQAKHTFDAFALTFPQGMILVLVGTGVYRPSRLATELNVRWPLVSKLLSDLEAQGFVERRRDSKDGRVNLLQLTPKGYETVRAALETWCEGVREDLSLSAEDHAMFEQWCKNMLA